MNKPALNSSDLSTLRMIQMSVGSKIEKYQRDNNLSKEELAQLLSMSSSTIEKAINGYFNGTLSELIRICSIIGYDVNVFFDGRKSARKPLLSLLGFKKNKL